jgi:hypothetical protein
MEKTRALQIARRVRRSGWEWHAPFEGWQAGEREELAKTARDHCLQSIASAVQYGLMQRIGGKP